MPPLAEITCRMSDGLVRSAVSAVGLADALVLPAEGLRLNFFSSFLAMPYSLSGCQAIVAMEILVWLIAPAKDTGKDKVPILAQFPAFPGRLAALKKRPGFRYSRNSPAKTFPENSSLPNLFF